VVDGRLNRGLLGVVVMALGFVGAARATVGSSAGDSVLQRFLSVSDPSPTQYRALCHFSAENSRFDLSATMDVWTEVDPMHGFRYRVVSFDGSDRIKSHVFIPALEAEQQMWSSGESESASVTPANYVFMDPDERAEGLVSLIVKPRRKHLLLVDGLIFVRPEDGELMRIEGRLSKTPSLWTRRVDIEWCYQRFAGIRMPVTLNSVASVLMFGPSEFRIRYEYESVNGQHIADPQPSRQASSF
jgi:hypothetical protein